MLAWTISTQDWSGSLRFEAHRDVQRRRRVTRNCTVEERRVRHSTRQRQRPSEEEARIKHLVMPKSLDKPLDLQYSLPVTVKEKESLELHHETTIDDELDFFTSGMAGTAGTSPFIKDEPEDFSFLHNYPPAQAGYSMHMGQQLGPNALNHMNPSDLSANGNYGPMGMTPQPNLSHGFNLGNSGIGDDELIDLELSDGVPRHSYAPGQAHGYGPQAPAAAQYFTHQGQASANRQLNQPPYSSTPDGAPVQSPFTHGSFHYAGFGQMGPQQIAHASPPVRTNAANTPSYVGSRATSHMAPGMNRQPSDSRSPMTPRTPGISAMHLEPAQSGSLPSQPINYNNQPKRTSGQWGSNPDSLHSHTDTPVSSPTYPPNQAQIAHILKSGKHAASLPAKVDPAHHPYPASNSQEAKRRKRRESHNLVERRRRDNINEKIQELSHLVPLHRLEDEKVRKHIMTNSSLSPPLLATGISPPQATSLLRAGGGRRATSGSISLGIPPEEKDKAPNKGDILNGSVSWTRDLMWALYQKFQQEDELAELISGLGGQWPFQQSEEEKRMRTELMSAMEDNDPASFAYSRGPGSGLRVPHHTNPAGEPLDLSQMGTISPQSLSPGDQTGGHGMHEINGMGAHQQFWDQSFKEEDEYGMEMN
ncbi:MAG: hypothetical protein Q9163_006474 [Psora crenata]